MKPREVYSGSWCHRRWGGPSRTLGSGDVGPSLAGAPHPPRIQTEPPFFFLTLEPSLSLPLADFTGRFPSVPGVSRGKLISPFSQQGPPLPSVHLSSCHIVPERPERLTFIHESLQSLCSFSNFKDFDCPSALF